MLYKKHSCNAQDPARLHTFFQAFLMILSSLFNNSCTPELNGLLDEPVPQALSTTSTTSPPESAPPIVQYL